jgi:hypothetical protein
VNEARTEYEGSAVIAVEGSERQFDVEVQLTGYVDVIKITTNGGVRYADGSRSWDGYITSGLSEADAIGLASDRLEIRLPDGRSGGAVLPHADNYLRGFRAAPFGPEE